MHLLMRPCAHPRKDKLFFDSGTLWKDQLWVMWYQCHPANTALEIKFHLLQYVWNKRKTIVMVGHEKSHSGIASQWTGWPHINPCRDLKAAHSSSFLLLKVLLPWQHECTHIQIPFEKSEMCGRWNVSIISPVNFLWYPWSWCDFKPLLIYIGGWLVWLVFFY